MAYKEFDRPAALGDFDAGRLDDWLKSKGIDARVQVRGNGKVAIDLPDTADENAIKSLLDTYTPTETPRETFEREAYAAAIAEVKAIAAKPAQGRTATEKVLLALALSDPRMQQEVPINASQANR